MIRLTGGRDKGRYIKSPKGLSTRPMNAVLRKVLFDTIGNAVVGALFLDVFAGVGTVGFEALSRGAKKVVFVEKNRKVAEIIRENTKILGYQDRVEILVIDAFRFPEYVRESYDIVFLGPPYSLPKLGRLPLLFVGFLKPEGLMIVQHHHKTTVELPGGYDIRVKKVGENALTFMRRIG
ncbi:MAG: 16S rRNA (guanine(966)-N(2))-methyltransferase RsmD [Thermosulfidibacteraceae bacterium]|jgi:16S rRNA (guanine966-N2)-methyltransferase